MNISIASDHAGFSQKQVIFDHLVAQGHNVIDRGPDDDERVDYPDYALLVAQDINSRKADRGVLVCGTGIGMAIAANKVSGVRAANVITPDFAVFAREHNDANVVTVSGRFVSPEINCDIVDTFLTTDFLGGRHAARVKKINALDNATP